MIAPTLARANPQLGRDLPNREHFDVTQRQVTKRAPGGRMRWSVGGGLQLADGVTQDPMKCLTWWLDRAARNDQGRQRVDEQIGGVVKVVQGFLDVLFESWAVHHGPIIA